MLALLGLLVFFALAIALAPIILGVIGSMLALMLTAILYVLAGCPKHEPPKRTAAEQAEHEAPMRQIDAWLEEERDHARDASKAPTAKPLPRSQRRERRDAR